MNSLELNDLINRFEGTSTFQSKMEGYDFDLFSDEWVLGYKKTLFLGWMHTLDSDVFLDLRLAIAHAAKHYAYNSLYVHVSILKTLCQYIEPATFEAWWLTLKDYKKNIREALYAFCQKSHEYRSPILTQLYNLVKEENLGRTNFHKGILDEKIGAYVVAH